MDAFKNILSSATGSQNQSGSQSDNQSGNQSGNQNQSGGSLADNLLGKVNNMAGGGKESEKNEDYLDKGVDFVQEKFLGAGDQSNESAIEQAKDEQISDFIRSKYKSTTGSDFPIADKKTNFDL
ncbi:hypothetical protein CMQ_2437 [Grosmannia clavigera kw1407]|uniref:DNA damage-responsive protein 48 n=1 Tax=Grosmannia clavigera (strain kw1407 / UAMH 11150) TaxID=655863 RepID=F0XIQ6_GROCL|nr:uncharacterized protein CMQ_2437 [Grosmannia clavigera kw1407]EFX02388.1 hypothetical protein CMQ_2437 [Grosmannia clavigera kw1407]